jgi:muconolactone delta-isomerase
VQNRPLVDQLDAARFERVRAELLARPAVFAASGCVVATWRQRHNRRFGPYYRLAFRLGNRQQSIYLGSSAELAAQVQQLLAERQKACDDRRLLKYLLAQARASLRRHKAELTRELAAGGIALKGWRFRRLRRARGIRTG